MMSLWVTQAPIQKDICRAGFKNWMEILVGLETLQSRSQRMTTMMFMISISVIEYSVFQWILIITTSKVAQKNLWNSLTSISCFNISKIWNTIEQLHSRMLQGILVGHLQCSILTISFWAHQTTMIAQLSWTKLRMLTKEITLGNVLITKLSNL